MRYHGVFAPNSKHRALVTPAKRGKGNKSKVAAESQDKIPTQGHVAMTPDQVRGRPGRNGSSGCSLSMWTRAAPAVVGRG